MNVVQVLNVKLQRNDQSVPWGFNVQGGKEFYSPLCIQKVNPTSLADRCSIKPGDFILKIGNIVTENLTHNQARDAIIRQGNFLELTIQRGAPPRPEDFCAKLDFPQHQLMTPENVETRQVLSPQIGVQLGKNKALLTQSYNSPMGLYSSQSIAETLVTSMKSTDEDNKFANDNELKLSTSCMSSMNTSGISSSSSISSSISSASVSPVSNLSQSSSAFNLNENSMQFNSNSKRASLDLNPRPKPFRRAVETVQNMNKPNQTAKIFLTTQNESLIKKETFADLNNYKNDEFKSDLTTTFKATPILIEAPKLSTSISKQNRLSDANLITTQSLPSSMLNLALHDQSEQTASTSSSPKQKEQLNSLKSKISNELKNRLSTKMSKDVVNAGVLKNNSDLAIKNGSQVDLSSSNCSQNSGADLMNARLSDRINGQIKTGSVGCINLLERRNSSPVSERSVGCEPKIVRNSPLANKRNGYVARLDNPDKPSLVQSRTFKLLQETLDNGLTHNELIVHDKTQTRRFSLNLTTKLTDEKVSTGSAKLEKLNEDENQSNEHQQQQQVQFNLNHVEKEVADNEKRKKVQIEKQKDYIRSLSLACDDTTEPPNFLKEFNQKKTRKLLMQSQQQKTNETKNVPIKNESETNRNLNLNNPDLPQVAQSISTKPGTSQKNILLNVTSTASSFTQPTQEYSSNYLANAVENTNNFSCGSGAAPTSYSPVNIEPLQSSFHQPQPLVAQQYVNTHHSPISKPLSHQQPQLPQHHFSNQRPFEAPVSPVKPISPPAPVVAPRPSGQRNPNRHAKGSALLKTANSNPSQVPQCFACHQLIRGPFISAIGRVWCPHHFTCAHPSCGVNLENIGFVEENGCLYCEKDYEVYFAPRCYSCHQTIMSDTCYALDKAFHLECFVCAHCKKEIGSGTFHLEDGKPYCPNDFNKLFSTKCASCQFPIEAGDKFLEALGQNWHVECFNCSTCQVSLQSGGFVAKGSKPYCKRHAY